VEQLHAGILSALKLKDGAARDTPYRVGLWLNTKASVPADIEFSRCMSVLVFVTKFRHEVFGDRHLARMEAIMGQVPRLREGRLLAHYSGLTALPARALTPP